MESVLDQLRVQLLGEPLDEWTRLDTETEEIQDVLTQLRVKRQSLNNEIAPHNALTSLIRRVPKDILEEILFSCLLTERNTGINATREAPLLLGFICRYWRAVSRSTPSLWNSLHIPWLLFEAQALDSDVSRLIQSWLDRAGDCPIFMSLDLPPASDD
ncbi:hypothetical protein B0H17DRAFT_976432, partial [Mycena rosella]